MTEITNGRQNKQLLGIHHSSLQDSFCIRCNSFASTFGRKYTEKKISVSYLSSERKKNRLSSTTTERDTERIKKNCGSNFYLFFFVRGKTISTSINMSIDFSTNEQVEQAARKNKRNGASNARQRTIKFYLKITYRKKVK